MSDQFAREYFQGSPLGKRFRIACNYGCDEKDASGQPLWLEIVGIVNSTRDRAVKQYFSPSVYYRRMDLTNFRSWQLLARTSADPASLSQPLQDIIRSVDKNAIVTRVQSLEQALWDSAALPRFQASVFGAFGVLALVLAMIGIFGVTAYSMEQRTKEIGIRMALGARVGQVMGGVVAQGAALALFGIGLGLGSAFFLARFVESMLFGVPAIDTPTYAACSALLLSAALLAFYLPARKAARIDPVQALRHD